MTRRRTGLLLLSVGLAVAAASLVVAGGWMPQRLAVVQPVRGTAIDAVYATGIVEPSVMLPIAPRSTGALRSIEVDEGVPVKQGQVLARLDAADLQSAVDQLEAQERYAHAQFQRFEDIVHRRLAAEAELDRVRADWQAALAALSRARAQLEFMTLRAPADGLVVRRDGEVGQVIAAGQAVFYLATNAPLRVTAEVDEEDVPRIASGQRVVLRAGALGEQLLDGVVGEVTPKGDPVARSYRVRIHLDGAPNLRIGMTVDANIVVTQRENAWLLPAAAVRDGAVWTIDNGRLRRHAVRTGETSGERIEVLEGLDRSMVVVAQPPEGLHEGRRAWARDS